MCEHSGQTISKMYNRARSKSKTAHPYGCYYYCYYYSRGPMLKFDLCAGVTTGRSTADIIRTKGQIQITFQTHILRMHTHTHTQTFLVLITKKKCIQKICIYTLVSYMRVKKPKNKKKLQCTRANDERDTMKRVPIRLMHTCDIIFTWLVLVPRAWFLIFYLYRRGSPVKKNLHGQFRYFNCCKILYDATISRIHT